MAFAMSSSVSSLTMATANWLIISVALAHIIWAPRIQWLLLSATTFMKPRSCWERRDFQLADIRYFLVMTDMPFSFASSTVIPTQPISGLV